MTYAQAIEQLGNREQKKIGNNTYLVRRNDGAVAIRLHATDILTFRPDQTIVVKTNGWQTVTTKARINEHLPIGGIYQKAGTWFWATGMEFCELDIISALNGEVTRGH